MRHIFAFSLTLLFVPALSAQPLTPVEQARLDPVFRSVVADAFPDAGITASPVDVHSHPAG